MRGPFDRLDLEPDQAVVEQQHRAGRDVARQLLVVEADAGRVAELARRRRARTSRPARASTLPSANLPTRIFGPCRSAMIATSRPSALRARRAPAAARSTWSEAAPCEKLRRTTSTPAASMRDRTAGSAAGGTERGDDLGGACHRIDPLMRAAMDARMLREILARDIRRHAAR